MDILTRAEALTQNGDPNNDFKTLELDYNHVRKKEQLAQITENTKKFKKKSIPHRAKLISKLLRLLLH